MIPKNFSASIEQLRETFVEQQEKRMAAVRKVDVPMVNQHHARAELAAAALASTQAGREVMEKLMKHPILNIQLSAAEKVMDWDPGRAVPFLGSLLEANLSRVESPDERLDIRDRAKGLLYKHFNIRSWDRNDLVEPLKAYGVQLSHRDRP